MTAGTDKRGKGTARIGNRVKVLNIRVPDDLILELDFLVEKKIFNSRSEAIREFAREYVQEQSLQEKNAKISEQGGGGW